MKVTFLMPSYMWRPSGGYRVVYEYANQLVTRGHQVTIVHPRHLELPLPAKPTFRHRFRSLRLLLRESFFTPRINWHPIDNRVRLLYVPWLRDFYIPDADVLFATAWNTAAPLMKCSPSKGAKSYLIQHYETWMGPKDLVDQTWRLPIRKVVISKWLLELGHQLGGDSFTYIPNGIDHSHYRLIRPIEARPRQVAMMCSYVPFKASRDGIAALEIAKQRFPDLKVVLFGNSYRPSWVPSWMTYESDPPQQKIVDLVYNGSSIMVSPSLTEGFGLPAVEAASCGCALVATDNDGHREYIKHGDTGLLSPPQDPQALAANICALLADDDMRVRLARSANAFVKQYSWQRSTDLMEAFLFETVQHKPLSRDLNPALQSAPQDQSRAKLFAILR